MPGPPEGAGARAPATGGVPNAPAVLGLAPPAAAVSALAALHMACSSMLRVLQLLEETKYHGASERLDKGLRTVSTRTNTSSRD